MFSSPGKIAAVEVERDSRFLTAYPGYTKLPRIDVLKTGCGYERKEPAKTGL